MPESSDSFFPDGRCDDFEATDTYRAEQDTASLVRRMDEALGADGTGRLLDMRAVRWDLPGRTPASVLAGRLAERPRDDGGVIAPPLTEGDYYAFLASCRSLSEPLAQAVLLHATEGKVEAAMRAIVRHIDVTTRSLMGSSLNLNGLAAPQSSK